MKRINAATANQIAKRDRVAEMEQIYYNIWLAACARDFKIVVGEVHPSNKLQLEDDGYFITDCADGVEIRWD